MAPFPDDARSTDQAHPALIADEDDRPMGPVTNETPPAAANTADRLDPALLKLAGIVLVGAVAVQLDATIVSVAINTLGRDLHAGLSSIQWVSTGYLLALAVVIPLTGWSVDRFGSKRMWMLSLALFLRRLGALRLGLVGRQPDRLSRRARPDRARRYGARHYRHDPLHPSGANTSELALGAALVIRGAGLGALFVPATTAAYYGLRNEAIPRATSTVRCGSSSKSAAPSGLPCSP
jgi:MFS family permease